MPCVSLCAPTTAKALTGVIEFVLLRRHGPLPFGGGLSPAAARRPGRQSRPAVVQRQQRPSGGCDLYGHSLLVARPHRRARFVKVLLETIWSGGGLESDRGSGGRGRGRGLLTGQRR